MIHWSITNTMQCILWLSRTSHKLSWTQWFTWMSHMQCNVSCDCHELKEPTNLPTYTTYESSEYHELNDSSRCHQRNVSYKCHKLKEPTNLPTYTTYESSEYHELNDSSRCHQRNVSCKCHELKEPTNLPTYTTIGGYHVSHRWMSHVTHIRCHTCHMSHRWMSHVTHINSSYDTYKWVMSRIFVHIRTKWVT